jgi:hypothetical protein
MSKINNNIIPENEDELNTESEVVLNKPKRQISDAQREHLNKIRAKAMEKKEEMKQDTLKAKLAKTIEKKELLKKYDDYTQEKEKEQQEIKKEIVKPKKEKKIVYKLADSSDSSDDDDEKVVYVKKIKDKKQIYQKPDNNNSLDSTLYKSSQEMLHHRAIEERVKSNLIKWNNAMMPQEF